jgi:EmrB/QacA subfamily drug resistance transporter
MSDSTVLEPPPPTKSSPPASKAADFAPGEDPKRWMALAVIAIAQLMVVLDSSIVNIALPSLQTALHVSEADRQWVVTAYTLTFGGFLLLGGRIADFMGRKRMFITGLFGFAIASALGGAANDLGVLLAARALQGVFAAIMAPAALSLISVTFTKPVERAKAFGVYGAIAGGGAAIGLILGGVLTQYASWRWCLLVNVPISLIAAAGAFRLVRESKASGEMRYDVPGAVAVTAGLASLVYGFTSASTNGWGATSTLSFIAVAVVLLVAFVAIQLRTEHPLLPLRVLLDRNRGGSFLGSLLAASGMIGMFLLMTFYFQGTLHYSALRSGFAFLPFSVGIIVAATVSSRFVPKIGPRPLIVGGFAAAAVALALLTQVGVDSNYFIHILPAELIMSMGMGTAFVSLSNTALTGVDQHDAGVASAALNATQQVGGSLGTALLNTIAATATTNYVRSHGTTADALAHAQVHGYVAGFTLAAVSVALAAVMTLLLIRRQQPRSASSSQEAVAGVPAMG